MAAFTTGVWYLSGVRFSTRSAHAYEGETRCHSSDRFGGTAVPGCSSLTPTSLEVLPERRLIGGARLGIGGPLVLGIPLLAIARRHPAQLLGGLW